MKTRRVRRLAALALCLALLAPVPSAYAHAFLMHAQPAVGSTVTHPPSVLLLRFSEEVEPTFCRVELTGPDGEIKLDAPQHPAGDPEDLQLALPPLQPGHYQVHWRAVSVDTHVTQGSFGFTLTHPL